jgi:hypothetical protein
MLVGMTLVVYFHTFGQQALTTHSAAATQDRTAIYGLATGTKAKLTLTGALGWLVSPLGHKSLGAVKSNNESKTLRR